MKIMDAQNTQGVQDAVEITAPIASENPPVVRDHISDISTLTIQTDQPRRLLPDEMYSIIFRLCAPNHTDYAEDWEKECGSDYPIVLSLVCKQWQAIARSTPHIWSCLHLVQKKLSDSGKGSYSKWSRILQWLRCCGDVPVHMIIDMRDPDRTRRNQIEDPGYAEDRTKMLHAALEYVLTRVLDRCERLYLLVEELDHLQTALSYLQQPVPRLRELSIGCVTWSETWGTMPHSAQPLAKILFAGDCPALTYADLVYHPVYFWSPHVIHQITTLHLLRLENILMIDVLEIFSLPSLVSLHLGGGDVCPSHENEFGEIPIVTHSSITDLHLRFTYAYRVFSLLEKLDLPNLYSLTFYAYHPILLNRGLETPTILPQFPSIRIAKILSPWDANETVVRALRRMTCLQELHVNQPVAWVLRDHFDTDPPASISKPALLCPYLEELNMQFEINQNYVGGVEEYSKVLFGALRQRVSGEYGDATPLQRLVVLDSHLWPEVTQGLDDEFPGLTITTVSILAYL